MAIARGRSEGWLKLPVSALGAWAELNNVTLHSISIGPVPGLEHLGSGVIAEADLPTADAQPLIVVPRSLVLTAHSVYQHAMADQHLRQVLNALAGWGRDPRIAILVFLFMQVLANCPHTKTKIGLRNPYQEYRDIRCERPFIADPDSYIKFLPEALLPTCWTEAELDLVSGTTLRSLVELRLSHLRREFQQLCTATGCIRWCAIELRSNGDGLFSFDDWVQLDAIYTTRTFRIPRIGDCMISCLDMANHAPGDASAARWDFDADADATLLLYRDKRLVQGDEVTITYRKCMGAWHQLFAYGFIDDSTSTASELFLELHIPNDDPLKHVKRDVIGEVPMVRLYDCKTTDATTQWYSVSAWLIVVHEENGLEIRTTQTTDDKRVLELYWQGRRVHGPTHLRAILMSHSLQAIYTLRAVSFVRDTVKAQIKLLHETNRRATKGLAAEGTGVRACVSTQARRLRALEMDLLQRARHDLEGQMVLLTAC